MKASKSINDVMRVIKDRRPMHVVDSYISLYLESFNLKPSINEWKAKNSSLFVDYQKYVGTDIDGVVVSLTADDQNGLVSVKTAFETQVQVGINPMPIKFHFENGAIIEFTQKSIVPFALKFMDARQKFFT